MKTGNIYKFKDDLYPATIELISFNEEQKAWVCKRKENGYTYVYAPEMIESDFTLIAEREK